MPSGALRGTKGRASDGRRIRLLPAHLERKLRGFLARRLKGDHLSFDELDVLQIGRGLELLPETGNRLHIHRLPNDPHLHVLCGFQCAIGFGRDLGGIAAPALGIFQDVL